MDHRQSFQAQEHTTGIAMTPWLLQAITIKQNKDNKNIQPQII